MAETCYGRFNRILKILEVIAAICGANIMEPNWKVGFHTWIVIIAVNAFFACTLYTIYIGFVVYDDWKVLLQSLCLAGGAVQGYSKLLGAIYRKSEMVSLKNKLESIYKEYQTDEDFLPALRYRTDLTAKILKVVMWINITTIGTIVVYPLIYGLLFNQKLLIMQFYLPSIDSETVSGYWVHMVVHAFLMCLGAFGNFAGDMYIFIVITHIPLLKDILKVKCEKFNRLVRTTKDPKKTMPMLKDIALWHQNYNEYVQQIDTSYYGVIFVQVVTAVVSISCTLFSIVIRSWPAAFAYLIYSSIMFYAYCGLGHLVEVSNDEVVDIFYVDCLWYEVSVPEQKLILLMLRKSQTPITLTVGQIMPLSMSTALQLTKAIYSYMMMLLNFLETDDM